MATSTIGNNTTSFKPLSRRKACRAAGGISSRRSSPRNRTGSVDARAAPSRAAAPGERPSNHQLKTAMRAAESRVPGPKTSTAKVLARRTSARLSEIASVKSTRTRLKVATMCRIGEASVKSSIPNPAGPRAAPMSRKTATWGKPVRSITPERSAAIIMTMPTKARVVTSTSVLN